jgi:hypothetical protein
MHPSLTPVRNLGFLVLAFVVTVLPSVQQPMAQEAQSATAAGTRAFSQQELDELLAPIALYPDALLAQVFMASTYPMEVVEASRWAKANPNLKGKDLEDALQGQSWDPAVKSIVAVPQVLTMMDEKLDWTQKLGDAFLAQQKEVMETVQNLRAKAKEAGNLQSTSEQTVKTEVEGSQTLVIIESAEPEKVYVPVYNPTTIYGTWWYSYPPPYYYYPPGYVARPGLWFAAGVIVGGAIWGNCNWRRNDININVNRYNSFNKVNIKNNSWKHNPNHRKGVAYRDKATASKYGRGGDRAATKSREQFRGRADQGRSDLKGMDRAQLNNQVRTADRAGKELSPRSGGDSRATTGNLSSRTGGNTGPRAASMDTGSAGSRDLSSRSGGGSGSRASTGSRGGGFSGVGSGASTRAASTRGSSSFGSRGMGGGSRGGGGGRR